MSTLWVETIQGFVRADAVTGVAVTYGESSHGWRLTATIVGGSPQGSWDADGGDVAPAVAELTDEHTDPTTLDHLPKALARALVRHRDAAGTLSIVHRGDGRGGWLVNVEFEDWAGGEVDE